MKSQLMLSLDNRKNIFVRNLYHFGFHKFLIILLLKYSTKPIMIYFATNFLDKFLFPSKNRKNFLLSILKFIIRGLYWMPDTPSKLFWFSNRCQMKFCFFNVRHNQALQIYEWLLAWQKHCNYMLCLTEID